MRLYPYQQQAVDAVLSVFNSGKRAALYSLPTGTGKTYAFVAIQQRIGGKALVIAHRDELLEQAKEHFEATGCGLNVQIECGTKRAKPNADIICASVQTLARSGRLDWFKPSLVVVDEAHHVAAESYQKVLERFRCAYLDGPYLVGCTATAERMDRKCLLETFGELAYEYPIWQAIEEGRLCPLRGYAVRSSVSLGNVRVTAGDFAAGELQAAVDVDGRTLAAIDQWKRIAAKRPTIAFCAGIEHAQHAAALWRAAGYSAEAIHGKMPGQREAVLKRFKSGETQVVTNVAVLTEGFDHKPVSCVVMLRPTKSNVLYAQSIGRATRNSPGKRDAIVLDVVDNHRRNSLVNLASMAGLNSSVDLCGETAQEARRLAQAHPEAKSFVLVDSIEKLRLELKRVNLLRVKPAPTAFSAAELQTMQFVTDDLIIDAEAEDQYFLQMRQKFEAARRQSDAESAQRAAEDKKWSLRREMERLEADKKRKEAEQANPWVFNQFGEVLRGGPALLPRASLTDFDLGGLL